MQNLCYSEYFIGLVVFCTNFPLGFSALFVCWFLSDNLNRFRFVALQVWLDYQALWDLQADYLYGKLGINIQKWMKALEDIKYVATCLLAFKCTRIWSTVSKWSVNSMVKWMLNLWLFSCILKFIIFLLQVFSQDFRHIGDFKRFWSN